MKSMNDFFTQQPVRRLLDTIDEFFDKPSPFSTIPIEMYETETELIISADLPGVKKEQIDIQYSEKYLTITVNHREEIEKTNEKKRSEEHTSELQSRENLVCRLLLEKK